MISRRRSIRPDTRDAVREWVDDSDGRRDPALVDAVDRVLARVSCGDRPEVADVERLLAWMSTWRRADVRRRGEASRRAVAAFVDLAEAALDALGGP